MHGERRGRGKKEAGGVRGGVQDEKKGKVDHEDGGKEQEEKEEKKWVEKREEREEREESNRRGRKSSNSSRKITKTPDLKASPVSPLTFQNLLSIRILFQGLHKLRRALGHFQFIMRVACLAIAARIQRSKGAVTDLH